MGTASSILSTAPCTRSICISRERSGGAGAEDNPAEKSWLRVARRERRRRWRRLGGRLAWRLARRLAMNWRRCCEAAASSLGRRRRVAGAMGGGGTRGSWLAEAVRESSPEEKGELWAVEKALEVVDKVGEGREVEEEGGGED